MLLNVQVLLSLVLLIKGCETETICLIFQKREKNPLTVLES